MGSTAALQMAGTALGTYGKVAAGYAQRGALDASANALTQEGGQAIASGIQGAEMQNRRAAYVASNAQARIAGGGLSTTGTSAQAVIGGIKGQGAYDAQVALYQGYDRASELNFRADQMRTQGSNAIRGGWLAGMNTVLTSANSPQAQSFFSKYAAGTSPTYTSQYSGGYTSASGSPNFVSG
jgi:hypothetical protein